MGCAVTSRQAAELYTRAGRTPPPEIATPSFEKVANTRRKTVEGIAFRSTLEADAYQLLSLWQKAGRISNLRCQPRYLLQPKMRREGKMMRCIEYVADFKFLRDGQTVVVDAKGYRMQVYSIKAKIFKALYPHLKFEEWDRAQLRSMQ